MDCLIDSGKLICFIDFLIDWIMMFKNEFLIVFLILIPVLLRFYRLDPDPSIVLFCDGFLHIYSFDLEEGKADPANLPTCYPSSASRRACRCFTTLAIWTTKARPWPGEFQIFGKIGI